MDLDNKITQIKKENLSRFRVYQRAMAIDLKTVKTLMYLRSNSTDIVN